MPCAKRDFLAGVEVDIAQVARSFAGAQDKRFAQGLLGHTVP